MTTRIAMVEAPLLAVQAKSSKREELADAIHELKEKNHYTLLTATLTSKGSLHVETECCG